MAQYLKYFTPEEPGSFSGISTFRRHHTGYSYNQLAKILSAYRSFTMHKPTRKRWRRNKIIVAGIGSLWSLDLSDLTKHSSQNQGYKFLFCAIDVFSKKAWVVPMKSKSAVDNLAALKKIFTMTDLRPSAMRSDKGREIVNKLVQNFLKEQKIHFYTSQNDDVKCAIVERFQLTLKTKLGKYMTHNGTTKYIDVLDKLVESYNKTYHRSIGMTPNQVNIENEPKVWRRLYGDYKMSQKRPIFKVGDYVRLKTSAMVFRKSYEGKTWTEEVFKVVKVIKRDVHVYQVQDLNGMPIIGSFYSFELENVDLSGNTFIVEKVIKTRRRNNKTEYFVKWKGYRDEFNSWTDDKPK